MEAKRDWGAEKMSEMTGDVLFTLSFVVLQAVENNFSFTSSPLLEHLESLDAEYGDVSVTFLYVSSKPPSQRNGAI